MQSYLIVQTPQLRYTQGRKNCCNLSCFKFRVDIVNCSIVRTDDRSSMMANVLCALFGCSLLMLPSLSCGISRDDPKVVGMFVVFLAYL